MRLRKGWKEIKLSELVIINSKTLGDNTPKDFEFKYISLSDVNSGRINKNIPTIKFSKAPSRARRIVSKGDILFSTVRPNLEGYFRFNDDANNVVASTGFAVLTPKVSSDSGYVYQYLYSNRIKSQIYSLVVGSNYPALNNKDVSNLKIIIPENALERKAIASLLSVWDEAIEKTERLIEAKERQFNAIVQKLIDKNCENWEHKKVKEIFENYTSKNHPNKELLSVTQDRGVIPRSHLEGRVMSPNGTTSGYKLVEPGDFVISLRSFQGGIEYSNYEGIVSPAYTVLKNKLPLNSEFYRFFFKTNIFIKKYLRIAIIGIRDGKQVSFPDFETVKIPYPPLEEQEKISDILNKAQKEMDILKELLETYKTQKRGLMQKLLTGKWRVKVNEEDKNG